MNRASKAWMIALCLSPLAFASKAEAATPGCNTTDPNCSPYDPCTFDNPLPGYECGAATNNATSNGTFITKAAGLGFTWNAPEGWILDSYNQLYWDCGEKLQRCELPRRLHLQASRSAGRSRSSSWSRCPGSIRT